MQYNSQQNKRHKDIFCYPIHKKQLCWQQIIKISVTNLQLQFSRYNHIARYVLFAPMRQHISLLFQAPFSSASEEKLHIALYLPMFFIFQRSLSRATPPPRVIMPKVDDIVKAEV